MAVEFAIPGFGINWLLNPGIKYFTVYKMLRQDKGNLFVDHS